MDGGAPISDAEFAGLIGCLGPFEPRPRLAVAVSGGADSLALALLAAAWAAVPIVALVVDHGLRPESATEARITLERLSAVGIDSQLLTLEGVGRGAARARSARFAALEQACAEAGILHLLLGHHAADQAETVLMRMLAGSEARGLAGMSALAENARVRLLRPLLGIPPVRLRATLQARGLDWIEDPSNRDPSWQRARLRTARRDVDGTGPATSALVRAARARSADRAKSDAAAAEALARQVRIYPQGFAVVAGDELPPGALAALVATVSGGERLLSRARIAPLARALRPCTIGGVRILPAGRLGPGWLLVREAAAMAPPVAAKQGALWDGRFRLPHDGVATEIKDIDDALCPIGINQLDRRRVSSLPAAVLRVMGAAGGLEAGEVQPLFAPKNPAAPAAFAV